MLIITAETGTRIRTFILSAFKPLIKISRKPTRERKIEFLLERE